MPSKLPIYDRRMLELMKYIIGVPKYKIGTQAQFLDSIGYKAINNVTYVKKGSTSFRMKYFLTAINKYGINPAFFFDELAPMFQKGKSTPIQELKDAVRIVEKMIKKN